MRPPSSNIFTTLLLFCLGRPDRLVISRSVVLCWVRPRRSRKKSLMEDLRKRKKYWSYLDSIYDI